MTLNDVSGEWSDHDLVMGSQITFKKTQSHKIDNVTNKSTKIGKIPFLEKNGNWQMSHNFNQDQRKMAVYKIYFKKIIFDQNLKKIDVLILIKILLFFGRILRSNFEKPILTLD